MKYVRLGNSGLLVSALSLGTLNFGKGMATPENFYTVDEPMARRLVDQAIDGGINYFNTADSYAAGHSERFLAAALGKRRGDMVIATKVGLPTGPSPNDRGLSRQHIASAVEASLRRLGSEWIDVLMLHCTDPFAPLDETLEALQQLIQSGKVRYLGVSNWPAWLTAKAAVLQQARGWEQLRAVEVYYSLLGRDVEHEIVPMAQDAGIGMQIWSPLAGGLLAARKAPGEGAGPASGAGQGSGAVAAETASSGHDFLPMDRAQAAILIERLRQMAAQRSVTPAQLSIAWLLSRPGVSSVIVGASSPAQLADNLGALDVPLDAQALAELDGLTRPAAIYPGWYVQVFSEVLSLPGG